MRAVAAADTLCLDILERRGDRRGRGITMLGRHGIGGGWARGRNSTRVAR